MRDRLDQPGVLRERDELMRLHEAPFRVIPTDQRLDAADPSRGGTDHRLVEQDQVILLHGPPELPAMREVPRASEVLLRVVERHHGARPLGRVHGHVASLEQRGGIGPVLRVHRDPDADVHLQDQAL